MRTTGVVGALIGALVFAVAGSGAFAPPAIVTDSGVIVDVARDGPHVAWAAYRPKARCFSAVVHRTLPRHERRSLVARNGYTCGHEYGFQFLGSPSLELAGKEALWVLSEAGNNVYDHLLYGKVGSRRDRHLREFAYSAASYDGDRLADVEGGGGTLVYAWYRVVVNDECGDGGECRWEVTGGSVRRVLRGRDVAVRGAGPAVRVSTNGPSLALVRASGEASDKGLPLERKDVEVRDVETGRLISSFRTEDNVLDIALGGKIVAVLLAAPRRIVRYDARTGQKLGAKPVSPQVVGLDAGGFLLVYAAERRIYVMELVTGQVTAFRARSRPIGLSVDDQRVTWAENSRGVGVVRSADVS